MEPRPGWKLSGVATLSCLATVLCGPPVFGRGASWPGSAPAEVTEALGGATCPVRVVVPRPAHITVPWDLDLHGVAVLVAHGGHGPWWIVPAGLVSKGERVVLEPPDARACPVKVLSMDESLGLARLGPAEGCRLPSRPLELAPEPSAPEHVTNADDLERAVWVFVPTPGRRGIQRVRFIGQGRMHEGFYLLHDAPWARAIPMVDGAGRLVGLAVGPSGLDPGHGLAIGAAAVREFLVGRKVEGRRPYRPRGLRPSWPAGAP